MRGKIVSINISDGGVPKLPVNGSAQVTHGGVAGDRQRNLKVHGGPDRAVCLYSVERITALQGEGGSIIPGAIGENITISGINWDTMTPGMRLEIGKSAGGMVNVLLEITSYTAPCRHVADYLPGRKLARILQDKNPGWSRVYARVLQAGPIEVGDTIEIIQ